ncbi:RHS repeat-associated core domain-containing protein [Acinetobacter bouvetii]|uniref:Deoxyribonuclease RhsC n=1 Tax=Acinetobacter bouvetii TaxID=202951 RepID=A0A811GIR8_9GAMM|nr:RHS repeat-associated core domain-containing protein [Acinetobacter bouvetii]CAB1215064.1 Putative deoxyribonuclease RhsC [Acinetobacter bouvetii]
MKTIVLAGKHYSAFRERLNTVSTHSDEAKLIRVNQNLPISQSMDDLRYAISIRLPGQNEDPITSLYDNGYRQYDPTIGRYLTPDPMGTVDGLNPYLYVANNPLNKVDPYGLYQTDMHYYMTYFLAITAGIDSDNARRIALATQFVDENEYTAPMVSGDQSKFID